MLLFEGTSFVVEGIVFEMDDCFKIPFGAEAVFSLFSLLSRVGAPR